MLEFDVSPMPNWDMGDGGGADSPFPFSGEESFAFDEGHPLDPGRRKERDSVSGYDHFFFFPRELTIDDKDHPMAQWVTGCRERFLDEMLRLEGRGDQQHQMKCGNCPVDTTEARYRCKDCFSDALFCQACLVVLHMDNPLHRVEVISSVPPR
jgi:hypothetical protein